MVLGICLGFVAWGLGFLLGGCGQGIVGGTTTTTSTAADTTTTTNTTSTTLIGSAMYCYTNGSPESYATGSNYFVGIQANMVSTAGTVEGTNPWIFVYSDGSNIEGINILYDGSYNGKASSGVIGPIGNDFTMLSNAVSNWITDSSTALALANANSQIISWKNGKTAANITVSMRLSYSVPSLPNFLSWIVDYGYNQSMISVTLNAETGEIVSVE